MGLHFLGVPFWKGQVTHGRSCQKVAILSKINHAWFGLNPCTSHWFPLFPIISAWNLAQRRGLHWVILEKRSSVNLSFLSSVLERPKVLFKLLAPSKTQHVRKSLFFNSWKTMWPISKSIWHGSHWSCFQKSMYHHGCTIMAEEKIMVFRETSTKFREAHGKWYMLYRFVSLQLISVHTIIDIVLYWYSTYEVYYHNIA